MSKTPRVDEVERLIDTNEQVPVGYVLSSVAKHLEIELNQALADLKVAQNLLEKFNSSAHQLNLEKTIRSTIANEAELSTPEPSPLQNRDNKKNRAERVEVPLDQVIKPKLSPNSSGESVEYADGQIIFHCTFYFF